MDNYAIKRTCKRLIFLKKMVKRKTALHHIKFLIFVVMLFSALIDDVIKEFSRSLNDKAADDSSDIGKEERKNHVFISQYF